MVCTNAARKAADYRVIRNATPNERRFQNISFYFSVKIYAGVTLYEFDGTVMQNIPNLISN